MASVLPRTAIPCNFLYFFRGVVPFSLTSIGAALTYSNLQLLQLFLKESIYFHLFILFRFYSVESRLHNFDNGSRCGTDDGHDLKLHSVLPSKFRSSSLFEPLIQTYPFWLLNMICRKIYQHIGPQQQCHKISLTCFAYETASDKWIRSNLHWWDKAIHLNPMKIGLCFFFFFLTALFFCFFLFLIRF